jgi:hypothetical protein
MAKQTQAKYLLGRDAVVTIDGVTIQSLTDAVVRVRTEEMSVANGVDLADSTLAFRRTVEYQAIVTNPAETSYLIEKSARSANGRPQLVVMVLTKGHITKAFYATIHDMEEDQPLGDLARTRWAFKQWGKLPVVTEGGGGFPV